jgi:hypothetical protein
MIRLVSANCHTVLSARKQLEALAGRMASSTHPTFHVYVDEFLFDLKLSKAMLKLAVYRIQ